jgi:hypothetical protein
VDAVVDEFGAIIEWKLQQENQITPETYCSAISSTTNIMAGIEPDAKR